MLPHLRAGLGLLLLLGVSQAHAQDDASYRWSAPPPSEQLAFDRTPVPPGQGALFIPSITDPRAEPSVLIVSSSGVTSAPVGRRVPLDPGRYVVLVGSSDPKQAAGVPVEVTAGRTVVVPVRWGALRVEVVDTRLVRHTGAYTLTRVDTGKKVEVPARLLREGLSTWLLEPGLYRISEPGSERLTSPDFLTVHVPEGGMANFRLFMDRRSGDFRGGGVVPLDQSLPDEEPAPRDWVGSLVAGVQGTATQTRHIPGMPDSTLASGVAFADGELSYLGDYTGLSLTGRIEQGQQFIEVLDDRPLPLLKTRDQLSGQALGSLNLTDLIGVYGRAAGSTQLFETETYATEQVELAVRKGDGSVDYVQLDAGDTYTIADALSPTVIKLGVGLNSRLFTWRSLRLSVRGGPGLRYNNFNGALISEDNPDTDALEYTRIGSFDQRGLEATASLTTQITGWAVLTGEADTFFEFGYLTDPIVELNGGVTVKLSDVFSLNYTASATRNNFVTPELSIRQGGFLRASWSLL